LGEIVQNGSVIDQAVVAVHRAPASYTGEDLVEISCHGGALVTAKVLETCLRAGARAARPGEFTERAYLNGKIDLTQAEAVIDLIRARTDLALRSATEQLAGRLGDEFRNLRQRLIDIIAHVEASMDFPEEGISPDNVATICARLESLRNEIDKLLATAETGRILHEGLRVVIFGATNAGKSSLLNRMLGFDRAIVSHLPEHADWTSTGAIRSSCKTGAGLPQLADEIYRRIGGAKLKAESPLAINARHREQLRRASDAIARALAASDAGATPEMFAIDLQEAQQAVDELLGSGDEEAVRDAIFSQFCIGK